MKWYKGTIDSPQGGCHVIHATSIKGLKQLAKDLERTDNADITSLEYEQHDVKTTKALVRWLNIHFNKDNG